MKLLLVAVNAKYIHSNLAVYSLRAYAKQQGYTEQISLAEYTINHSREDILKGIYQEQADVIAFSCYIWNIELILKLTKELKQVQPKARLWLGGPEVSYDAEKCLLKNDELEGIMLGEGEHTFLELVRYYTEESSGLEQTTSGRLCEPLLCSTTGDTRCEPRLCSKTGDTRCEPLVCSAATSVKPLGLNSIKGIAYRKGSDVIMTGQRLPLSLNELPFPYEDMEDFKNRIIYYESSRGCPFSCSYCLSSIDGRVRFRDTELVKKELKFLLDREVPQVKFVDRTFNCNKVHAMEIWRFIKEQDNGITNFHFEISADLLEEGEIAFLATLRPAQVQLEIGVQTTNPASVEAIRRKMDLERLKNNVLRIRAGGNIHQHLDLIAGLPCEDYSSFERSFREVYELKPDQLQLGFLKVLKGSPMEEASNTYGIVYREEPPYEVLYTEKLTFGEVLKLKGVCDMVEIYYNSGQFKNAVAYLEHFFMSPMRLYEAIYDYYESKSMDAQAHSRIKRYELLWDFFHEKILNAFPEEISGERRASSSLFEEILLMDLLLREGIKSRPSFTRKKQGKNYKEYYDRYRREDMQDQRLQQGKDQSLKQEQRLRQSQELKPQQEQEQKLLHNKIHIEEFTYDIAESAAAGTAIKKKQLLLFDYRRRDPITKSAFVTVLEKC
jgi:radical SAM superfamily enzyme YgiQ (UPF0313 family)